MTIAISGSTGFIGNALSKRLQELGFTIIPLTRKTLNSPPQVLAEIIEKSDIVINLAGAPILKRWTKKYKQILLSSRIDTTQKIVAAINSNTKKPDLFISASAIGIYDSTTIHNESSNKFSNDFLFEIINHWEIEAKKISSISTRMVITRIGIVLSEKGGAFPKMYFPFKIGLGGKIGNGQQGFSYIHLEDLINSFLFIIDKKEINGIVNLVSPEPVNNIIFTKTLSRISHKPALFTVPAWVLKLIYGEAANVLLSGQKVVPEKLVKNGFDFKFGDLEGVLKKILKLNNLEAELTRY